MGEVAPEVPKARRHTVIRARGENKWRVEIWSRSSAPGIQLVS